MTFTSWSIQREDITLLRALEGVSHETGFYIDVGANHPTFDSDTRLFYDHGWHGINIEPSPRWYKLLAQERPRDINIHAAASNKSGFITLYDHPEGGLGTISETFADRHAHEFSIEKKAVRVPAVTLASVCEQHAAREIHFLKIDVEGHEQSVIEGMDFRRFRPWILCIEAVEPLKVHIPTHDAWDHLLIEAGYVFAHFDGLNRWYVAAEHPERLPLLLSRSVDYVHWTYLNRIQDLETKVRGMEQGSAKSLYELVEQQKAIPVESLPVLIGNAFQTRPENDLYEALYGGSEPVRNEPSIVGLSSSLCRQLHFSLDSFRYWMKQMGRRPRLHRKDWEWFYIAQAFFERGKLMPEARGLVFAVGKEPLPSVMAKMGCRVVATDQAPEAAAASGWSGSMYSSQVDSLHYPTILDRETFITNVQFEHVDMNNIPHHFASGFDFCWSSCAFEHLGSLELGMRFVENSMETLRPGGVAVHTTEYNLSSDEATIDTPGTSIYRRRDINELVARLEQKGYSVEPIDWTLGRGFAEVIVDPAPYRQSPHLKLSYAGYDCTSIGLIISKPHQ